MSARDSLSFGLLSLALSACTCLTEPGPDAPTLQAQPQAAAAPSPAPTPPPAPSPSPPAGVDAPGEQIGAAHILIAYKGSLRAAATVTRSKEEAQKLAKTVLAQAKGGANFGDLAVKYSDDPSAKQGQGSLGKFGRNQMVKPFADAAFALKPGEVSGIVETPFGFHVIKRTE
jgi:parvulin-like peptidyl-prolyl isomerase